MTLLEASKGRDNNLNLMRIVAAVMKVLLLIIYFKRNVLYNGRENQR